MIEKRNILIFIAISFGLSWPIVLTLDTLWPTSIKILYLSHGLAMMMPGLACVIMRKWISKEGFSDCGFRIGNRLAYLIVIFSCLLLWGLPTLADVLWGGGKIGDYSQQLIIFTVAAFFLYLIPAFGEELGWRGFLLQKFLPMGRRRALILHGAIWGAWHWPILFAMMLNGSFITPELTRQYDSKTLLIITSLGTGMVGMVIASVFLGAVAGWLRLRFGSIYLVTFWHAYYDYFRDILGIWFKPGGIIKLGILFPMAIIFLLGIIILSSNSIWGPRNT
ncbi:MAG: CPBP family intramembrane metalloprotease [Candidatus Ratteibacteria bacterium]|nr:CPBP family intramembrane metalloprotease [Candidatus Ratteibacteria bacterium]